jgi:NADH-quinone oxidoreductase subunit C
MTSQDLIAALQSAVPDAPIEAGTAVDDDVTPVLLTAPEHLLAVCKALRDTPGLEFVSFSNVTAADWYPRREPRFDVVYHFVSPHRRARVRLKIQVAGGESIASIAPLWPGADWPEREIYDLFGIVFEGHPDLRRLMMPEDWEGHPLRKDYPVQIRKDAQTYMPLQVTEEEFRANMERDRHVRTDRAAGPDTRRAPQ